jgi:hypothetical protein
MKNRYEWWRSYTTILLPNIRILINEKLEFKAEILEFWIDGCYWDGICHTYNTKISYVNVHVIKRTPWSRLLLEKLIVAQLIQEFPAFYGIRKFITVFTRALLLIHELSQINPVSILTSKIRYSSAGIAQGYRLDDRGSTVRFPAVAGNFSLNHHVQNGFGAHPTSYPVGSGGSFPGG